MGVWGRQWLVAVIASISIVITAAYIMRNIRQVFFGEMPDKFEGHLTDITVLHNVYFNNVRIDPPRNSYSHSWDACPDRGAFLEGRTTPQCRLADGRRSPGFDGDQSALWSARRPDHHAWRNG